MNNFLNNFRHSVRTKVSLVLFFTILFLGLVATSFIYWWTYSTTISKSSQELIHETRDIARELETIFTYSRKNVETIAGLGEIRKFVTDSYQATEAAELTDSAEDKLASSSAQTSNSRQDFIREELSEFNLVNDYQAIYLIDNQGLTLVSTDRTFEGKNFSYRRYFQKAMQGQPCVDAVVGSVSQELGYYLCYPIYDDYQHIVGAAVGKLNPKVIESTLSKMLNQHQVGVDVLLFNQYQQLVFSNQKGLKFEFAQQPTEEELKALKYTQEDVKLLPESRQDIGLLIDQYQQDKIFQLPSFPKKNFVISKLDGYEFYLVSAHDVAKTLAYPRQLSVLLGVAVLSQSILTGFIIFVVINRLSEPLSKLKEAAQQISQGNWNYQTGLADNKDEFGQLAASFEQMSQKLAHYHQDLETEVEEKTHDLENKVQELEKMTDLMTGRELKMKELKEKLNQGKTDSLDEN